ncbi:hypothetical protein F443_06892 [Phytophthora nicotianae P1569]|uniref:Uncharacterized protein n=1 Tax=Phytophthora nicotianae P1569 TaxID=1317065 RepID=V9FFI8_PHYNI|nr:hypothetical protein F443_06892 [Phytophthora nicotianae P1569]
MREENSILAQCELRCFARISRSSGAATAAITSSSAWYACWMRCLACPPMPAGGGIPSKRSISSSPTRMGRDLLEFIAGMIVKNTQHLQGKFAEGVGKDFFPGSRLYFC